MHKLNGLQKIVLFLIFIVLILCIAIFKINKRIEEQILLQNTNIQKLISERESTDYNLISEIIKDKMNETLENHQKKQNRLKKDMEKYSGGILEEDDIQYLIMLEEMKNYENKKNDKDSVIEIEKEKQLKEYNQLKSSFPKLNDVEIMKLMEN